MNQIKNIYNLFPYITSVWIMLNIIGNTIKMTFMVDSKYIVWILLIISVLVNFIFLGTNFESLFIALISFSFSVSSYDLIKYGNKIVRKI